MSETMTAEKWKSMTAEEREAARDYSQLTPQLKGLEGWRVEVVRMDGERARFYVGRSTGWIPIHLEVKTRRSMGGGGADREYKSVRRLYKGRS